MTHRWLESVREDGGDKVASLQECRVALDALAAKLGGAGADDHRKPFDRTLSCHVSDLDTTFSGQIREGQLSDITTEQRPRAQVRLTTTSDDLVAMTDGHLSAGTAWARGRLKVEAGIGDLLRLRTMF